MSDKGRRLDVILSAASGLSHEARYLAIALLRRSNRKGQCWPSLDTLCTDTGMSRRKIVEAIDALEHATGPVRIVVVRRCRKDGPGRASNVYTLTVNQSSNAELNSSPHQSSNGTLKSPVDQSVKTELKSRNSSVDLSSNSGGPEFQNGGDLSSDVGTGTYSGNLLKEPTQKRESARERAAAKKPSKQIAMPADFVPNETVYTFGAKLGFDRARVDAEAIRMRNDAEAKGVRRVDWQAAARTWLDRGKTFDERDRGKHNGSRTRDVQRGGYDRAKGEAARKFIESQQTARPLKEGIF